MIVPSPEAAPVVYAGLLCNARTAAAYVHFCCFRGVRERGVLVAVMEDWSVFLSGFASERPSERPSERHSDRPTAPANAPENLPRTDEPRPGSRLAVGRDPQSPVQMRYAF